MNIANMNIAYVGRVEASEEMARRTGTHACLPAAAQPYPQKVWAATFIDIINCLIKHPG